MYGVGVTTVPAFVWILPVKAFMPPVAIGEPVAGLKSKPLMPLGTEPLAGIATNSAAAVPVLLNVSELPAASRELRRRRSRVRLEERRRFDEIVVTHLEIRRGEIRNRGARGAQEGLRVTQRDARGGESREHAVDVEATGATAQHHAEAAA